MKLKINTEHCILGIQKASNINPAKAARAHLSTMWLKADKESNTISFMSTDSSTEFIGSYPAEVDVPGFTGVQAKFISDLIRSLPADVIDMEIDDKGNLTIKQGRKLYKLPTCSSEWFQNFQMFPDLNTINWTGEVFTDIIDKIVFCIGDESESYFECLYIKPQEDGYIDFCGLDGSNFALYRLLNDALLNELPSKGILIQKKYLFDIKKIISQEDIEITLDEKRLFIRDNDKKNTLSVPLVSMNYIDYKMFLDRTSVEGCSVIEVKKDEFIKALNRIAIFNTKNEFCVYIKIEDNSLELNSSDRSTGSANEIISAQCQSSVPEVAFVTKKLIDILQHIPEEDLVIKIASTEGPCSFQGKGNTNYTIISMPVQVVNDSYYDEDDIDG